MNGFNSFLGGMRAGQDVYQRHQSAFNASMMLGEQGGAQVAVARQIAAPKQQGEVSGKAPHDFGGGDMGLSKRLESLDTAKRQEIKADLLRKKQVVGVLANLPPDEQLLGIETFGKDWGIDEMTLQRAAANPVTALAEVASAIQQSEKMLEQTGLESRVNNDQHNENPRNLAAQVIDDGNKAPAIASNEPNNPRAPREPRPPYAPLEPRPPYPPNEPHPPRAALTPRPPYAPLAPRPPYSPRDPHPSYAPRAPRPPYEPRTPMVPVLAGSDEPDTFLYPGGNTGPQRDTLLIGATHFGESLATNMIEASNGFFELTVTSAGEPLKLPGKTIIDRFSKKIPKDKTKELINILREPVYANTAHFTFERYVRKGNGKLTLAWGNSLTGKPYDTTEGTILNLKPGEAQTVAFDLNPGIYKVTVRGGSGALVYTKLDTVNYFSDGNELEAFTKKTAPKNVIFKE